MLDLEVHLIERPETNVDIGIAGCFARDGISLTRSSRRSHDGRRRSSSRFESSREGESSIAERTTSSWSDARE